MKRLLSTALRPYGAVILAMFCFALSFVWFKQAIVTYGPLTIVLFRMGLSSVVLLVFTHLTNRLRLPTRRDFRSLLLLAFFEPFVYFMCESYGLRLLSSTVGAVIVATIPLVAPIAGYLFYRERMTWRHLLGIAVSFGGVTLVVYEVGVGFTASPLGVLLEFGAVLAAVAYTVVLHRISDRLNNLSIIFYQNILAFVYFLPFWLVIEARTTWSTPFDPAAMGAIVKLSLFVSTLAFIFFTYSVRHLGITKANMFVNMVPVFTAVCAYFILGDPLTLTKVTGIAIVIAGLFVAQLKAVKTGQGPDPIPRT